MGQTIGGANVGRSAPLVRGEAGMGKSRIIAAAVGRVRGNGCHIFTTTGVQSEPELPFAGPPQLSRPLLGGPSTLPVPQRNDLGPTFGLLDAGAPELSLMRLATLSLLVETAGKQPLLLVVEDAQWLDRPTLGARLRPQPGHLVVEFVCGELADPVVA